ncbi:MAG: LysM domain-containing protein [Hyphomicrobiales bacterium]|nr:MAG: LysM domain-containing protein [Hyphomicrobiales bacterium]
MDPNPALPVPTLQPFDEYSRYRGLDLLSGVDASGRPVVFVARRFLPQPASLAEVGSVTVKPADRLDILAAQQLGDARWWWRLADANGAIDPAELTAEPGRVLRLTLPQGMAAPRS